MFLSSLCVGFASPVQTGSRPDDAPQQTTASPSSTTTTTTTSSTSSSTGFGDLNPPPGWNCDVCLVQNKPSDTKCVCCMAPQPNSSSSAPLDNKPATATSVGLESSSSSSSTSAATTGLAAVFTKAVGSWDCDTCLVRNKSDAVKCVACETAKPGTGLKTSLTIPSAFSAIKAESTPATPASTGFVGFGDKFKQPEGAWECDTCMVVNKAEAAKCVSCMSAKPGNGSLLFYLCVGEVIFQEVALTFPFFIISETGAPVEASAEASAPVSAAPVLGFGDAFKKPEGSWDCDVCLVTNKAAVVECVACQTPKPGAKVEPKGKSKTPYEVKLDEVIDFHRPNNYSFLFLFYQLVALYPPLLGPLPQPLGALNLEQQRATLVQGLQVSSSGARLETPLHRRLDSSLEWRSEALPQSLRLKTALPLQGSNSEAPPKALSLELLQPMRKHPTLLLRPLDSSLELAVERCLEQGHPARKVRAASALV